MDCVTDSSGHFSNIEGSGYTPLGRENNEVTAVQGRPMTTGTWTVDTLSKLFTIGSEVDTASY
jgi:hypothetical protein